MIAASAGCGKKGDPEPPLLPVPRAAADLTVEQRGTELILRFAYPHTTAAGMPLPPLERIEVYELVRPAMTAPAPATPAAATPGTAAAEAEPETGRPEAEAPEPAEQHEAGATAPEAGVAEPEAGQPEAGAEELEPAGQPETGATAPEAGVAEPEAAATEPAPGAGETGAGQTPAAAPRYLAQPVDAREFAAAATVVRTLRGDELAGAVHGDRLVVALPLPSPLPEPPRAHLFAVRTAAEGDFVSAFSNQAGIVPEPPPPPPTGLTATPRPDGIEIAWKAAARPAGFHAYRRLATERGFGPPLQLVGPAQDRFLDRGARYGQRYIYAVTAVARRAPLVESAIAAAREVDYRDAFPPPVPAGLVALADEGAIRLVWDASHDPDLAGYRVHRSRGDGAWQTLTAEPIDAVEYADAGVAAGETYRYRVTAVDLLGNESAPSAEAQALAR